MTTARNRPKRLDLVSAFKWYMPEDPPVSGCWDWRGCLNNGYGFYGAERQYVYAHVVSYELHVGPTNGLWVLHECDRPICVQPNHLHLGSNALNVEERERRGRSAKRARNGNAKLSEAEVEFIRSSSLSQVSVASLLGVSQSTISSIRRRETWK